MAIVEITPLLTAGGAYESGHIGLLFETLRHPGMFFGYQGYVLMVLAGAGLTGLYSWLTLNMIRPTSLTSLCILLITWMFTAGRGLFWQHFGKCLQWIELCMHPLSLELSTLRLNRHPLAQIMAWTTCPRCCRARAYCHGTVGGRGTSTYTSERACWVSKCPTRSTTWRQSVLLA